MTINKKGFTLVELLIVIGVIGILMAYVIPSYQRQVIVSKRTEAKNVLMQIASAQERNNVTYKQYASIIGGVLGPDNLGLGGAAFLVSVDYNYTMAADAVVGYTITATAIGSTQVNDDFGGNNCTVITLNGIGVRGPLDCWQ